MHINVTRTVPVFSVVPLSSKSRGLPSKRHRGQGKGAAGTAASLPDQVLMLFASSKPRRNAHVYSDVWFLFPDWSRTCTCACVSVCVHVCNHTSAHVSVHTRVYKCTCTYPRVCEDAGMSVCAYVHINAHLPVHLKLTQLCLPDTNYCF